MYLDRDAEFLDPLFREMKRQITQWRSDLSSLDSLIAKAIRAQKSLYAWR